MAMESWEPSKMLVPRKPLKNLADLAELEHAYEDLFFEPFMPTMWGRLPQERKWVPPVEVFEEEDAYVVRAELPGVKKEDIDISLTNNTLTIKGGREVESEVEDKDFYCCELNYGSFYRSISLPANIDAQKIEASQEDGVLEIKVPKATRSKSKKISISSKKKS